MDRVSGELTAGFDLTAADSCGQVLDGNRAVTGRWTPQCQSQVEGRGYARYYGFTLERQSQVTVELESAEADTYLYLRAGDARSGAFLYEDDDSSDINRSEIVATLGPGRHAIEATTHSPGGHPQLHPDPERPGRYGHGT